jgi:peptidoglycan/xylan/chitin deacetylase (PgdA/CDA1 family)
MIRKWLKLPLGLTVTVVAVAIIGFQISKSRTFQFFGEIVPRVNTQQKAVALTFDDGPIPGSTEEILSVLNEGGIKGTFFVTGAELEQHPEQGKLLVAAGHELGNHSFSHSRMVLITPSFVKFEIERTDELIRQAGYQGPIHFRPPFGKKLLVLPYYLSQHSRKSITWDVEPDSFPEVGSDASKIVEYVLANAKPGSIILLHVMYPNRKESLRSVKGISAGLKSRGFEFKTVSELLASTT